MVSSLASIKRGPRGPFLARFLSVLTPHRFSSAVRRAPRVYGMAARPTTITLSSCVPGSIHKRWWKAADHINVSPGDTLAALKAKICDAMGLPPALMPERSNNRRSLVTVGLDDSLYVVKHLAFRVGVEGWCHPQQEPTVFVKALPEGGIELFRYAEGEREITAIDATMCSTLRLWTRTRLSVKLEAPREIPRYSRFIVNGRLFQLSPEKSVGDLQARCARALSVPVKSQVLLAFNRPVIDQACSLGQLKRLLDQSCDGEIKLLDLRDPAQARAAHLAGVERAASSGPIHISIKTSCFCSPFGLQFVDLSDSIENVKAKIQDQKGVPMNQHRLTRGGVELKDGFTISDYTMQDVSPFVHHPGLLPYWGIGMSCREPERGLTCRVVSSNNGSSSRCSSSSSSNGSSRCNSSSSSSSSSARASVARVVGRAAARSIKRKGGAIKKGGKREKIRLIERTSEMVVYQRFFPAFFL